MALKMSAKILIVDDMSAMRKILKNMLNKLGFQNISDFDDGASAWKELSETNKSNSPYELIISDWSMPVMNGLELLQKIKADELLKKIPFLMITAEAEQDKVVIALKAGVTNFMVKPFTLETLKEKIDKIV
jgi:two-component system chemotaxis response regulator CheY